MKFKCRFCLFTITFIICCFYLLVLFFATTNNRFAIYIYRQFRIFQQIRNVTHYIKSHRGSNIEEFTILTNAQIRQAVNLLVNLLFNLVIFRGFKRSIYFKRQRNGSIVQLLRAHIHWTRALSYLDSIFTKTWIGKYINVTLIISVVHCAIYLYSLFYFLIQCLEFPIPLSFISSEITKSHGICL